MAGDAMEGDDDELVGCTCRHGARYHGRDGCWCKNGHDIYCDCTGVPRSLIAAAVKDALTRTACKTHPRYAALRKPRSTCEPCWRRWFAAQDARNRKAT